MIKDVTPAKLYKINDKYNLIVVDDRDGEVHNLVFSNREILKSRFRGVRGSSIIPEYKIKVYFCTEVFLFCTTISLLTGFIIGYLLGL